MSRPCALALVVLCVIATLGACVERPTIHAAPEPQTGSGEVLAGAAKVDITPIAGVPLGGHSFEGGTGYGVWTRLWARAIYVEDEHGEPLVLAVADLWSIPAGLADAVVERVREHHGLTHIGRAQLLLSATHTHHSPANFSTTRLYNRVASRRMGFDPELFEFLVDRIAAAVAEAAAGRAPAQLRLDSRTVPLVVRNRSVAPFMHNPEAELLIAGNAELPRCPDAPRDREPEAAGVDPCQAVDPTLTTLRIEDRDGEALAIAAFFAVHATSMINATDAYNGDLFAVATAHAEAALHRARPELGDPVVALFNGPEGDVSPNWRTQGRADALALGTTLGAAIVESALADEPGCGRSISGAIESGFERVALASQAIDGPPQTVSARRALGGKAVLVGAEDGRTRHHERFSEGQTVTRERRPGHGAKKPVMPPALFTTLFPPSMIPQVVPISVHRVGPLSIVGLPGEFTTIMGMRIRQAVATTGPAAAPRPVAIGLAGEYMSYFVTPEEYALQHYEGGSTLWGQYAGALMTERIAALAQRVGVDEAAVASTSAGPSARVAPGLRRAFALGPDARTRRALDRLDQRLREQLGVEAELDALPRLHFDSAAPSWDGATWPTVRVEVRDADGRWAPLSREGVSVDERGTEFVMFPRAVERGSWSWAIWWIGELPEDQTLRLHSFGPDASEHCSAAFEAGDLAAPEAVDCTRRYAPVLDPRDGLGVVPGAAR
ncbi:Neutral ceramidase [Enhygromyxa salina]|uniref:Neutral ceramidase n=1 Tax=Enhygromyxa salina TaxID=215803 RepID=A0A2S9YIZ8_9BACT|nr:neutral/alkaline non-lysosomal ceramidase N-terminal domain-containing protein [Enhygromyxa salina]PRQ05030.1 Neutral ceramidase [Enhygromyxa salina]